MANGRVVVKQRTTGSSGDDNDDVNDVNVRDSDSRCVDRSIEESIVVERSVALRCVVFCCDYTVVVVIQRNALNTQICICISIYIYYV
jgi:hypothetical protein